MKPFVRKLVREPLVHFLALGAGLFLLNGLLGGSSGTQSGRVPIAKRNAALSAKRPSTLVTKLPNAST